MPSAGLPGWKLSKAAAAILKFTRSLPPPTARTAGCTKCIGRKQTPFLECKTMIKKNKNLHLASILFCSTLEIFLPPTQLCFSNNGKMGRVCARRLPDKRFSNKGNKVLFLFLVSESFVLGFSKKMKSVSVHMWR